MLAYYLISCDVDIHICKFISSFYLLVMLFCFQGNKLLKVLLLGNNSFEDEGARLFKSALSDNTTLEVLDLSWNNFKNKGAILLAEALQVNTLQLLQNVSRHYQ